MGAFVKHVVYGNIATAGSWSISVEQDVGTGVVTIASLASAATAVRSAAVGQLLGGTNSLATLFSDHVSIVGCKSYLYANYNDLRATAVGESPAAASGGSSTPSLPPQVAVCVTKLTGRAGASGRGRLFLPLLALPLAGGDFQFAPANATRIAAAVSGFLAAVNTNANPSGTASPVSVISRSKNAAYPISGVRCDSLMDTIRARRDKLVPTTRAVSNLPVG